MVNNQIGFTTTPDSARLDLLRTDVAKGFDCPVFHVNGDDPEAVVWVGQLAIEYRRRFGKDVFIDLVCYRRRGHNEADDPSMTQPLHVRDHRRQAPSAPSYTEDLIGRGDLSRGDAEAAARDFHDQMESVFDEVKDSATRRSRGDQTGITGSQALTRGLDTSISREASSSKSGQAYVNVPEGFEVHPRVGRWPKKRTEMRSPKAASTGAGASFIAFGSSSG